MRRYSLFALSIALFLPMGVAFAKDADVERFDAVAKVGDISLALHGQGTRKATLFAIQVYHAAFYSTQAAKNLEEILASPRPQRLDIRYLRDFDLSDTRDAWTYQFRESAGVKAADSISAELQQLVSFQRAIKKGDVHRFELEGEKTTFFINEERVGAIEGPRFQIAFLTVFFGATPPTKELQRGLLSGPKPGAIEAVRALGSENKGNSP